MDQAKSIRTEQQGQVATESSDTPLIWINGLSPQLEPFVKAARERIFSLAAGNRMGKIGPEVMQIGYGKVLYAATQMGADVDASNSFVLFAPDGTCSLNPVRTERGFSYGGILNMEFDGMMAINNSMPNGCGFSIYELNNPMPDPQLIDFLQDAQQRLGHDQLSQLGKGNHFAGVYYVMDPMSGEDTGRRFCVVHCSGHVDGHLLYHPESWLEGVEGHNVIKTPHGDITLLEGEAKRLYREQFNKTNAANAHNRDETAAEIFAGQDWTCLESITHQGINPKDQHIIGTQQHNSMVPIAFNPEEGLVAAKTHPNLSNEFIDSWTHGQRARDLGLAEHLKHINLIPHGGGYELRYPLNSLEIKLGPEGISSFTMELAHDVGKMSFSYFREVREWLTYRRKTSVMREVYKADLGEVIYEMPGLMQVYPLKSIPGGSH